MAATRKKATSTKKAATNAKTAVGEKKKARTATGDRKYAPAVADSVREEMEEMKAGELRSGRSGKKVTNPKQAIAIGLSEARRAGEQVPPNPNRPASKTGTRKKNS